ncbi:hypothetical protein [Paraburkholderia silvatlantica]|uniref:Uncharacterized protein n=1 Tax=Paraburkholderia silvatlantica TaxID=321895 RepID=A0ABR6FTT4_9BURK|nr:hypothetical protein [Paraburkholderia silvatlantica]MBB2930210.1 hypothetical protein [Paraburkholderia silvatlantica]
MAAMKLCGVVTARIMSVRPYGGTAFGHLRRCVAMYGGYRARSRFAGRHEGAAIGNVREKIE